MLAFDCVLPRRHALRAVAAPLAWLTALLLLCGSSTARAAEFTLQKGDHICLIGNTLPERMQHFGWLETLLQNRFPDHELVIRNLGYSADELIGVNSRTEAMPTISAT